VAFLSCCAVLVLIFLIYRVWATWLFSVVGIFILTFTLAYVFRATLLGLGLDGPYPDRYFQFGGPVVLVNIYLTIFLCAVAAGLYAGSQANLRFRLILPAVSARVDARKMFFAASVATGVWVLVMGFLVVRYGGFNGIVRAAKVDKQLAGLFFLQVFPVLGTNLALATLFTVQRERVGRISIRQRQMVLACVSYSLFNGIGVYYWGARALLVITVVQAIIGYLLFRPQGRRPTIWTTRRRLFVAICLALVLGVGLVLGLRILRDQALSRQVSGAISGQSVVRQISVSSNSVSYDAFLLAVRDWPSKHRLRGGVDIYNGVVGAIPRAIWSGKPTAITPGAWFRQVYEPRTRNGWPMGPVGIWYLNFGLLGVIIGGLLTGLLLSAASRVFAATRTNPLVFVTAFSFGIGVIGAGATGESFVKWAEVIFPLFLVLPFIRERRRVVRAVPVGVT
jgi:hypothetical protein